jgi:hypothetical protein
MEYDPEINAILKIVNPYFHREKLNVMPELIMIIDNESKKIWNDTQHKHDWEWMFFNGKCPYCNFLSIYDSVIFSHCRKEHPNTVEGSQHHDEVMRD